VANSGAGGGGRGTGKRLHALTLGRRAAAAWLLGCGLSEAALAVARANRERLGLDRGVQVGLR